MFLHVKAYEVNCIANTYKNKYRTYLMLWVEQSIGRATGSKGSISLLNLKAKINQCILEMILSNAQFNFDSLLYNNNWQLDIIRFSFSRNSKY